MGAKKSNPYSLYHVMFLRPLEPTVVIESGVVHSFLATGGQWVPLVYSNACLVIGLNNCLKSAFWGKMILRQQFQGAARARGCLGGCTLLGDNDAASGLAPTATLGSWCFGHAIQTHRSGPPGTDCKLVPAAQDWHTTPPVW